MDVTYDPCIAQVVAEGSSSDDEIAGLDAALALWNERGGFRLSRAASASATASDEPSSLIVRFEDEFGAFRGYYHDEIGEIIVNRRLSGHARTVTIAHEIGHAFGLWHLESSVRRSVMNPGNTTIEPLPHDVEDVRALWGRCD